jgi:hypothetical protein
LRTCLCHLSPDELILVQQGLQTLAQALQAWSLLRPEVYTQLTLPQRSQSDQWRSREGNQGAVPT